VVAWGVAAAGDTARRQPSDLFGEEVARAHGGRSEGRRVGKGAGEEGGHLHAGDVVVGAEGVVAWGAGAAGDAGGGEGGDVVGEDVTCGVGERVVGGFEFEGAGEEGGHLAGGDVVVGAEVVVAWGVAAAGDTARRQPIDLFGEEVVRAHIG